MFSLTGCGTTTVKLDKYVTFEASGYDSMGTVTATFDYDAFEEDYEGKIKVNEDEDDGTVTITPDASRPEMSGITFTADKTSGLSTGDNVIITASISGSLDNFVQSYGCVLDKTEETYTVGNLAHYVTDLGEIPGDLYSKMDQQLQDAFNAHKASDWAETAVISEFKLIGNYMVTLKDGMSGSPNNYVFFVYKLTYSDEYVSDFVYYWYGYYQNVMVLEDGTCTVDISSYVVSESESDWGYHSGDYLEVNSHRYVAGFADIESLFNQYIVSKIDNYNYVSTVEE